MAAEAYLKREFPYLVKLVDTALHLAGKFFGAIGEYTIKTADIAVTTSLPNELFGLETDPEMLGKPFETDPGQPIAKQLANLAQAYGEWHSTLTPEQQAALGALTKAFELSGYAQIATGLTKAAVTGAAKVAAKTGITEAAKEAAVSAAAKLAEALETAKMHLPQGRMALAGEGKIGLGAAGTETQLPASAFAKTADDTLTKPGIKVVEEGGQLIKTIPAIELPEAVELEKDFSQLMR